MVRVFEVLGRERRFKRDGFEFVSAKDYAPKPTDSDYVRRSDVPWLARFAKDGGKVVVSGDVKMMDTPHEMEALRQHGFRVFLFERKWADWDFFQKVSLLMFHWPVIAKKIKSRSLKAGQFWRIANHFRSEGGLYDVTPGAKKIQKTNSRAAARQIQTGGTGSGSKLDGARVLPARPARRRKPEPVDQGQGALDLTGGGPRQPARASKDEE